LTDKQIKKLETDVEQLREGLRLINRDRIDKAQLDERVSALSQLANTAFEAASVIADDAMTERHKREAARKLYDSVGPDLMSLRYLSAVIWEIYDTIKRDGCQGIGGHESCEHCRAICSSILKIGDQLKEETRRNAPGAPGVARTKSESGGECDCVFCRLRRNDGTRKL
jgi:hypothetical protein